MILKDKLASQMPVWACWPMMVSKRSEPVATTTPNSPSPKGSS